MGVAFYRLATEKARGTFTTLHSSNELAKQFVQLYRQGSLCWLRKHGEADTYRVSFIKYWPWQKATKLLTAFSFEQRVPTTFKVASYLFPIYTSVQSSLYDSTGKAVYASKGSLAKRRRARTKVR